MLRVGGFGRLAQSEKSTSAGRFAYAPSAQSKPLLQSLEALACAQQHRTYGMRFSAVRNAVVEHALQKSLLTIKWTLRAMRRARQQRTPTQLANSWQASMHSGCIADPY